MLCFDNIRRHRRVESAHEEAGGDTVVITLKKGWSRYRGEPGARTKLFDIDDEEHQDDWQVFYTNILHWLDKEVWKIG